MSGLIWVQTVCKVINRQQKSPLASKDLNTKQLDITTFRINPWLKLNSFGYYFFHLAKVWLQQILSQGKPCGYYFLCHFSTDAVSVPIVLLVLEGGPGTLETVHQAIQNNTPAVIVKVCGPFPILVLQSFPCYRMSRSIFHVILFFP